MAVFMTADEAVKLVKDGDTVVLSGAGGGLLEASRLMEALGRRFEETAEPKNLTLVHVSGLGDRKGSGLGHLAHRGLVKRVIGGHWGMAPKMSALAAEEEIEAYNLPQGVLSQLMREIAGGRVGLITHVGLGTFIDPRIEGGKLNKKAREDIVQVIEIAGQERLFFPSFKPNIALIKGSICDELGNISLEREPANLENLSIAQAVHNSGGKVIVQVQQVVEARNLHPRLVKIPACLVDVIVVVPDQWQNVLEPYNPGLSGEKRIPISALKPMLLDERKVIARRAAMEIKPYSLINIGVGMPDGIAAVAAEEGFSDKITFTIEQGLYGGVPAGGVLFGMTYNPECIMDAPYQFDFFDGGGLDTACLGLAQVDRFGNVNVSKMGKAVIGTGGFVNIAQNAKKVVFCGTFTGGGLQVEVKERKLQITQEGKYTKFVADVDQITFSGKYAISRGQEVLYVTERAVFQLTPQGVVLCEIAPGVDLEKDILNLMPFKPLIAPDLKVMDERIFDEGKMGLGEKF
jgi:propionate CoA-transferase